MRLFPYRPGDTGDDIRAWQEWFNRAYQAYAPPATGTYDDASVAATKEMQRRLGLHQTGNFNIQTAKASGYISTPVFVTVEGHTSNMFFGPVADTATQLEREGLCRHQPTGYNNAAVPFDNQSGVIAVAENIRLRVPPNAPLILGGFSQGMIVVYDYLEQHGAPSNLLGCLFYGNPCRAAGSGGHSGHGLDPYKRFGLPGCVPQPPNTFEVLRDGDIFAQNTDDVQGNLKASIYQAVARGDFVSNPYSLVSELLSQLPAVTAANYFELLTFGIGIFQAIVSGIAFLADNPNPHYSPYDISGGLVWARDLLT